MTAWNSKPFKDDDLAKMLARAQEIAGKAKDAAVRVYAHPDTFQRASATDTPGMFSIPLFWDTDLLPGQARIIYADGRIDLVGFPEC